jgi:hypothetical protein
MAIQNLQASSAIAVVPSDTIDIPNPAAVVASGTTTGIGSGSNNLKNTNATFTDGSVSIGNIVHDTRVGVIDTVAAIVDDNNLTLTNSTNIGSGSTYNIYDHTAKAQPSLYVGVTGDVSVEMAGTGSAITYKGVPAGATLPINVTRVNSTNTTATDIVALF